MTPTAEEATSLDDTVGGHVEGIRAACAEEDGHDPLDEAARLRLKHHGLAGSRLWLVEDAGFALLHDGGLDLAVRPTARAAGVGTALAGEAAPETRTAWSHGNHPAARALAARHGFRAVRELWVMRRPVADPLPSDQAPTEIRGYRTGDRDELLRVNAAAFVDHPEQGAMDSAALAERMAEPWFDPAGLLVAGDADGPMLGFHWTKQHSDRVGEVYVVATAPAAQGRGLGRALTLAGLRHLAGVLEPDGEVILYVESDNLPARRVYERLGFTHADTDTHVQYGAAD